jgi:hypothetical protein
MPAWLASMLAFNPYLLHDTVRERIQTVSNLYAYCTDDFVSNRLTQQYKTR